MLRRLIGGGGENEQHRSPPYGPPQKQLPPLHRMDIDVYNARVPPYPAQDEGPRRPMPQNTEDFEHVNHGPQRRQTSDKARPTAKDVVIAVMGVTGAGKTTFIQQFCDHDLNVGHGLESCTSKVEVIPCYLENGRKIFLIDTPGFDDTYRSDTEILRDIADWLSTAYQNQIRLTGIIYLHRISDVRVGGAGMKNLRMFRKLCGERGLGSVVLATTMWSVCRLEDAVRREEQLLGHNDFWQYLMGHGARVFRHDDGPVSGFQILSYLVDRARPVVLEIQHEMVDKKMKLSETEAGREVQEELERMKEKHEREMKEIRQEMEEAVQAKDEERQAELQQYRDQINRQMAQAAQQARKLEASRDQLRAEMQAQHAREMQELREEVDRRQKELESRDRRNQERNEELMRELQSLREKADRQEMTGWFFKERFMCPGCGVYWLFEDGKPATVHCLICKRNYSTG